MHSKVIIASLVFGLSIGFATIGSKSVVATAAKEDETAYALQKQGNDPTKKEAAIKDKMMVKEGGGSHTHVYNSSYSYRNDAYHYANCSCGATTSQEHVFDAYYEYGHGHNDMIHCSLCDTNIWMTALQLNNTYPDSVASQSAKWYYFRPTSSGYYTIETTGSYDTYGDLYVGNYPTSITTSNDDGGVNRNFRITRYFSANQNVFLRVRGWSWAAVSFTLSVTPHTHSYTQTLTYDSTYHKKACACGSYYLQAHAYDTYVSHNDACHTMKCACGRQLTSDHTFDSFYPYGHGHNDMIHCSTCGKNVECYSLNNNSYNDSFAAGEAKWYFFESTASGTYIFETTGNSNTYGELYVGSYPATRTTYDDNSGNGDNFRIIYYLSAGTTAFLRIRENDWDSASYSVSVTYHAHNYSQVVDYDGTYHKRVCVCGSYYLESHSYSCSSINNARHIMSCACGKSYESEHTFNSFAPYGHGHNDMIHCSTCNNNIECYSLNENDYSHYVSDGDANWYFFEATDPGTYIFETTGDNDTYGYLYVGNFPTTLTDENDDAGEGYNFKLPCYLEAGERAFIRVTGYDWEYAEYTITVTREEPPAPATGWTILLYMDGVTADEQLCEIESITEQKPNDVNILVETNISHRTHTEDGYLHRYTFQNGQFQDYGGYDGRNTRKNMGLESTFRDFLYLGVEEFLNDHMGLILYNHGRGIQGVCFDSYGMPAGQEDSLTSSEIASACQQVFQDNNISKFDFIGYDACVMQVQDVAEFNSPYFDYQIASEEEEAAVMGWAYDEWMDDLFRHASIEDMMREMCDGMVDAGCNCETSWGLNLSALDLRKMGNYKTKFEQLASAMTSTVNANRSEFESVILSSYQFGTNASNTQPWHGHGYGNFDCQRFFNNLRYNDVFNAFESLINEVEAAYDELVFYCAGYGYNGGSSPASGMSIQHLIYPEYHIYPVSETHFYNWRNLFVS